MESLLQMVHNDEIIFEKVLKDEHFKDKIENLIHEYFKIFSGIGKSYKKLNPQSKLIATLTNELA